MKKFLIAFILCTTLHTHANIFQTWSEWNSRNRKEIIDHVNKWMGQPTNSSSRSSSDDKKSSGNNDGDDTIITFQSIIGGIPQEILELKEFLSSKDQFDALGIEKPTGILLVGPPGTGKTLLAKALAYELDAGFIATSAASFIEIYVGTGPLAVRNLFKKAQDMLGSGKKHVIIFIDEIDSIGSRKSGALSGGVSEENKTINELLVQMDGFDKDNRITILAATNKPDFLDTALLRPGRFDYKVNIPLPDAAKRRALLLHYLTAKKRVISDAVMNILDTIAKKTAGFNCADIKELVNRTALQAMRARRKEIEVTDLESALAMFLEERR